MNLPPTRRLEVKSHNRNIRNLPPIPWTYIIKKELDIVKNQLNQLNEECKEIQYMHTQKLLNYMKYIDDISFESAKKSQRIRVLESINSELYAEIDYLKTQLSEYVNAFNFAFHDEKRKIVCECCCDYVNHNECVQCSHGHYVCENCLERRCQDLFQSLNEPSNEIQCFCIHDCSAYISEYEIGRVKSGRNLLKNYDWHNLKGVMYDLLKTYTSDEIEKNLVYLKCDGNFNAVQCPSCGFGPIVHSYCDDLETHHNQNVGNGIKISNTCPRCNFFSSSIKNFVPWNGHSSN